MLRGDLQATYPSAALDIQALATRRLGYGRLGLQRSPELARLCSREVGRSEISVAV